MTSEPRRPIMPPLFIEVVADATHQGKTTISQRIRDHGDEAGIPTTYVRVESRQVTSSIRLRNGDIFIATEDISGSDDLAGGVSGVLRPAFSQIDRIAEEGGMMILDWAGGLGGHRRAVLAATSLDSILARRGIAGMTVVATTNAIERIEEARETLAATKVIAPGFRRVIALNKRTGGFNFPSGSPPFKALNALKGEDPEATVIEVPKIVGDALGHLQPLGLEMKQILGCDATDAAHVLGSDEFTVMACLSHLAAWYQLTGREIGRILPFRAEEKPVQREVAAAGRRKSAD